MFRASSNYLEKTMSKPMSNKAYLSEAASVCPVCKSEDISSGHIDADGTVGYANVECLECKSTWVDKWKLTGYQDLEVRNGKN